MTNSKSKGFIVDLSDFYHFVKPIIVSHVVENVPEITPRKNIEQISNQIYRNLIIDLFEQHYLSWSNNTAKTFNSCQLTQIKNKLLRFSENYETLFKKQLVCLTIQDVPESFSVKTYNHIVIILKT